MNTQESSTLKNEVRSFWNRNPCAGETSSQPRASRSYFDEVESERYRTHVELKAYVRFDQAGGKKVLEIGCGLGTDGRQFAGAGADYTGIDLTEAAIQMARENFAAHGLQGTFLQADAEKMPFESGTFDIVYSFGVLHHTPRMEEAFLEVARVLKPGGRFIVMVYHARSWNYYVNIMLLRRIGALLLFFPGGARIAHVLTREPLDRILQHQRMLRRDGLAYLRKETFLSQNTDGPGNPLSRVFTRATLAHLLNKTGFPVVSTKVGFLHKRWIPILGRFLSPGLERWLASRIGWHLYGIAQKPS